LPPVSSLSWAENEVRFPVRFAKNRTSFSCLCAVQRFGPFRCCASFSFVCPATTNKESADPLGWADWTHLERAKHWSTINGACGRLSTDQLQSV